MLSDLLKVTQENESQSPGGAPTKEGRTPSPAATQLWAQSPRKGPGLRGTIPEQRPSHAVARCHPRRGRPGPEAPHGPSCGAQTRKCLGPLGTRDPERWGTSWHRRGDTAEGVWPRVGVWNLKTSSGWQQGGAGPEGQRRGHSGAPVIQESGHPARGAGVQKWSPAGRSGSQRPLSWAGGSPGDRFARAGHLRAPLSLSPTATGPRGRKEAVQAALLGSRLPGVLVSERREGASPPAARRQQAASYVQSTREKGAGGSAQGPSPRPRGSGPTKAL